MKVVLSAHQKYHIFRLAENIEKAGALSALISIYPHFKVSDYAISKTNIIGISHLAALKLITSKLNYRVSESWFSNRFDNSVVNHLKKFKEKPDIFHGLSGYCLESIRWAKRNGIKTVLDRACPHIEFQTHLLNE